MHQCGIGLFDLTQQAARIDGAIELEERFGAKHQSLGQGKGPKQKVRGPERSIGRKLQR